MDVSTLGHACAVIGGGIGVAGAAIGIGMIGAKALDAIARQPEESKNIRSNMILMAALIEGLGFFIAIVAFISFFVK